MEKDETCARWKKVIESGRPLKAPDWADRDMCARLLANQEIAEMGRAGGFVPKKPGGSEKTDKVRE